MALEENMPGASYLDELPASIKVDKALLPGLRKRMPGLYRTILDGIDITVTNHAIDSRIAPTFTADGQPIDGPDID